VQTWESDPGLMLRTGTHQNVNLILMLYWILYKGKNTVINIKFLSKLSSNFF
jgi:hypothetical protein